MAKWIRMVALVCVVGICGSLVGCTPPPKPKELQELERILRDPEARTVKKAPGAEEYYREAREYRREALVAHDEGELKLAKHYATLGKLRYRTAEAISNQWKEAKRLKETNAKIRDINPEVTSLVSERDKLRREVQQLHRRVEKAKAKQRQAEYRKRVADMKKSSDGSADKIKAENTIRRALEAKQEALNVKADEFAEASFNQAQNNLKSARSLLSSSPSATSQVVSSAEKAQTLFKEAKQEARPKYQEYQAKMKPEARLAALKKNAENTFGQQFVYSEEFGVRVVLAHIFEEGGTEIRPASRAQVNAAADFAKTYQEFTIDIEGYTRESGDETKKLATSNARAQTVEDFFESKDISGSRLSTEGKGSRNLRFEEEPGNNDRVEVIFRLPAGKR